MVSKASNYGFVTGKAAGGTNANFIVIADDSAPTSYQFEIGDAGTSLEVLEDGAVKVLDANGTQFNYIMQPWARDANGVELPTSFSAEGNVLTQHVNFAGAASPVIADPTTGCGVGWCSVYFNRSETQTIAGGGSGWYAAITAGCALIHPAAGVACGAIASVVQGTASSAYNNGNCVGIVGYGLPGTVLSGWNPFVEPRGTAHSRSQ